MDEIQSYLDKKSINDQLSTDEKRQLNYIIQNMRAVESVFDKYHDIFFKVEKVRLCNLEVKCVREFEQNVTEGQVPRHLDDYQKKDWNNIKRKMWSIGCANVPRRV